MARALNEANGVSAHAEQIYWRLRATAIQQEAKQFPAGGGELYVRELRARLDAEDRSRKLRSSLIGWMWVVACFAGFIGAFIFFIAAKASFYRGTPGFYGYAVTGIACVALAVVAFVICKRDAGHDPFSDR